MTRYEFHRYDNSVLKRKEWYNSFCGFFYLIKILFDLDLIWLRCIQLISPTLKYLDFYVREPRNCSAKNPWPMSNDQWPCKNRVANWSKISFSFLRFLMLLCDESYNWLWHNRTRRLIEGKAKYRKGTLQQVFICPRPRNPYSLPCTLMRAYG